ncbi:MAG: AFG1/ZapE family ATPase, partial [Pseudomonas sp.]
VNLCPNPLYRDRFKPAIELLESRFSVLNLDAGEDYRERAGASEAWGYYAWPLGPPVAAWLEQQLDFSAAVTREVVLEVNHHPLRVLAHEGNRALLDFDELCRHPHSSADFLWLCQRFRRIAIYGVPRLDGEGIDVQQRILNVVDIAYDSGVQLLLGCEAELDEVCRPGSHLDFVRTRSRLRQLTTQHLAS